MREALPLLFAAGLLACENESGFTRQEDDVDVVSGNGEMVLEPDSVDLWGLTPENTTAETLVVMNVGENNLVIYRARIINSGEGTFYLPDEWKDSERTIGPGQSLDMILAATLAEEGTKEGSLHIESNDVNTLDHYVTLRATTDPEESEIPCDTGEPADSGDPADSGG